MKLGNWLIMILDLDKSVRSSQEQLEQIIPKQTRRY